MLNYKCPKCHSYNLGVTIITSASLLQSADENVTQVCNTDTDSDHEWDDSSTMWCNRCVFSDCASAFITDARTVTSDDPTPAPASQDSSEDAPEHLDETETATILAALRFYQEKGQGDPAMRSLDIHDIATADDYVISLDDNGIDDLCEKLNTTDFVEAS